MLCEGDDDNFILEVTDCLELNDFLHYSEFYDNHGNASLNIFHTNIRSYNKNFDELVVFLNQLINVLDIIVLTECWLGEGGAGIGLNGFNVFQTDKQRNRNDGVVLYLNKRLTATAAQITLADVYGLSLDFTVFNKRFHLFTVYRTFSSNPVLFVDELERYVNNLDKNRPCVFLGDINFDLLQRDVVVDRYLELLLGAGFTQCINKPTRVNGDSISCLDHIFLSYHDFSHVHSAVFQTNLTDHYSTGLTITSVVPNTHTPDTTTQPHTYIDRELLAHYLRNSNWEPIYNFIDVNHCTNYFNRIIMNSVESAKKLKLNQSSRYRKLKPWITMDLIRQIRLRDKLNKRIKRQPFNAELINYYRAFKLSLNTNLKVTKRNYYRFKLNEGSNNPKQFWHLINELAGRVNNKDCFPIDKFLPDPANTVTSYKDVANDFNSFFSNVGKSLADAIDPRGVPVVNDSDYLVDCSFTLRPVPLHDLLRYVYGLRGGSAPGYDGVSVNILKDNFQILCKPLLYIVNLSLTSGSFPDCYKLAKVFPLYKSGDITDKNNFRPISLLSIFTKIIEKIVKDQLVSYLQTNNILCDCQYGFREEKNISDALFDINRELNRSISDKKKHPMMIFLD